MSQRKAFDWRSWAKQVKNKEVGTIDRKIDWPETKIGNAKEVTERIIQEVETKRTDLTSSYQDWIIVGFALADEFGVSGRPYFHRLSQFHPDYSIEKCDNQFTKCLNSKRAGVTIGSLFYMAQEAGIILRTGSNSIDRKTKSGVLEVSSPQNHEASRNSNQIFDTPRFAPGIYEHLPRLLQQSSALFEKDIEKDVFLVGF